MNGFVGDIVPESTSKPSSFIPGFEVKGSLFEAEIKEVQETAVRLVMQRMGRRAGGRAGRQKAARDLTESVIAGKPCLALIRA